MQEKSKIKISQFSVLPVIAGLNELPDVLNKQLEMVAQGEIKELNVSDILTTLKLNYTKTYYTTAEKVLLHHGENAAVAESEVELF